MMRTVGITLVAALAVLTLSNRPASAGGDIILDAHLSAGVDPDFTAIGRLHAGATWVLDNVNLGFDAQLALSAFLRLDDAKGIQARSFSPLNLGVRYGFWNNRFHGPYAALGAGFGLLAKPHERRVEDPDICATAQNKERCSYDITQQLNGRLGFGWGFASGKKTTVGVRLDLAYFMFNLADGEDQPDGNPNPNLIDRPQGTWAVLIGLEFMRWR